MNQSIEMHDSECLAVEVDDAGRGFVLFEAYVHRTHGEPGVSPGEGGVQRIRLEMSAMTIKGEVGSLPAYVYEGSLTRGDSLQDNMVPFPASYPGSVSLNMMLSDDARVIVISGQRLSITTEGEFKFVETASFTAC